MTVIVAYADAEARVAFVGGDSKRLTAPVPVTKVHRWGEAVVFGQAGNGTHQSKLIGEMMACRGAFGDDLGGFETAFTQLWPFHSAAASTAATAASAAGRTPVTLAGTLLVADAIGGRVIAFDFLKGTPTPLGQFGVAGLATQAAAANVWARTQPQLDLWAVDVIKPHVGKDVDWPIDLLIVRPSDQAGALTVQRRHEAGWVGPGDPLFHT